MNEAKNIEAALNAARSEEERLRVSCRWYKEADEVRAGIAAIEALVRENERLKGYLNMDDPALDHDAEPERELTAQEGEAMNDALRASSQPVQQPEEADEGVRYVGLWRHKITRTMFLSDITSGDQVERIGKVRVEP